MTNSPRKRRKERNREMILDAATFLVEKKGLANVSLREIARKADYSPAALYKYFDGKEGIVNAVMVRENLNLIEKLSELEPDLSPFQRLVELCMRYIEYSLGHPVYNALLNSLTSGRRFHQEPIPAQSPYSVFLEAVRTWVEDAGIELADDYGVEETTYALWAQIHGMATLRLSQLREFEADFDLVNRRTIEIYLQGLKS